MRKHQLDLENTPYYFYHLEWPQDFDAVKEEMTYWAGRYEVAPISAEVGSNGSVTAPATEWKQAYPYTELEKFGKGAYGMIW